MKGIILAGGLGTRLRPITNYLSKQSLPVFDKPMIYYPLSTLIRAGIREVVVIAAMGNHSFYYLLGDGSRFGLDITHIYQEKPNGIAQAFILGRNFIGDDNVCLILGDNIFHGHEQTISDCLSLSKECTLFGYKVKNPESYGVATLDKFGQIIRVDEKPENPNSNICITGLYAYDSSVVDRASQLKPSKRGELEITDINNQYISEGVARLFTLPEGVAWLDMGSPSGLLQASNYVQTIQERQGIQVGCPEEAAFKQGFLTEHKLVEAIDFHKNTEYGNYLRNLIDGKD